MIKKTSLTILVVALSGCAWQSSDQKDRVLTEKGFLGLNGETQLSKNAVSNVLDDKYHLISGVSMKNKEIQKVIQARQNDKLKLNFYANAEGKLVSIESFDPKIKTKQLAIGSKFSKLYQKAFNHCQLGFVDEQHTEVECLDPKEKNIRYTFTGQWKGPSNLIPSDDQLKSWTVSKITWFSQ